MPLQALLSLVFLSLLQGEREPVPPSEVLGDAVTGEPREQSIHVAAQDISLVELFEALSKMRGVPIDYERSRLEKRVTIRSRQGFSEEALWASANRLLQAEGLACIQASGEEGLSIVPLETASALARIERDDLFGAFAGYVKVVRRLEVDPTKLGGELQKVFEKSGAKIEALPETKSLLIAGLLPSVEEVLRLLQKHELERAVVSVVEIPLRYQSPVTLAALLEQLVQKEKALDPNALRGSVVARPGSGSLMLVAEEGEIERWRELILTLDREEGVVTRWYVPWRFGLGETAGLLGKLFGEKSLGLSEGPYVVSDPLSGSLIVTATLSQHEEIEEVFRRLEETDAPGRRELRSFSVCYRDVEELLEMLAALVDAGAALPMQGAAKTETEGGAKESVQGATGVLQGQAPGPIQSDEGTGLSLSADPGSSRILAFGEPWLLEEVEALLETLDVPRPQVLVEALVVSLSQSEVLELGVELRKSGTSEGVLYELASLFGLGAPPTSGSTIPPPGGAGGSGVVLDPGNFSAVVRALSGQNRGRTLSLPKVLVENHSVASLDSVLHTPYLATNATTTVATTSLGGSEEAGTQIRVTPHIGEGDRLRLEYSVSVSSFVGAPSDPALPPPRQENKLEASASLPDGYAVVVGGLEVEAATETRSGLPWLSGLPLFGWLFREDLESRSKSRLYVFLRTNILRSENFEDLRWHSEKQLAAAGVADGLPKLKPRIIR